MKLKILSILFFLLLALLFVPKIYAQSTTPTQPNQNYLNTNPNVPQDFHTYTQSVFIEVGAAISCQLSGIDPINPDGKCLGIDPKTKKIGFVEGGGGAIGLVGNLIAETFYIPISTHDYVADVASNFGIAKRTYAQNTGDTPAAAGQAKNQREGSIGFNSLLPTLKLWQVFRNVTYLLFVILFVIVGLGIMFRIKIDPRTVMTLQNQIPKIIMAIIFVTFSYAIAGFLIDMMYVSIYLIMSLFSQAGIDPSNSLSTNPFGAAGGIGGVSGIAFGVAKNISGITASIFDGTLGRVLGGIIGTLIGGLIGQQIGKGIPLPLVGAFFTKASLIGGAIGGVGGAILGNKLIGLIAGLIAYIVIIIAIFQALLRIWFQLIKCYISVLVTVVFSPFYIASGLIPGRSGLGAFFRGMLSNLAVFPATITLFLLGQTFINGFSGHTPGGVTPFIPPLVGDLTDPSRFGSIIGLGIILMAPEAAVMVKDALKSPDFKYSSGIGRSLSAGPGIIGQFGRGYTAGLGYTYDKSGHAQPIGIWRGLFRSVIGG